MESLKITMKIVISALAEVLLLTPQEVVSQEKELVKTLIAKRLHMEVEKLMVLEDMYNEAISEWYLVEEVEGVA